jgi:SAM-dependent methyltransferase
VSAEPATIEALLAGGDVKACCAAAYEHPLIRWLLGGDLHPGGEATTRRSLELLAVGPGGRLLDVASGRGASALLAARERGCEVVGLDYGADAVAEARAAAAAVSPRPAVEFVLGDAESLPFAASRFDAVLCECSLCTFPDKVRAVEEMRRVLRPSGRLAISDVVADRARLPRELEGPLATVACVGEALDSAGYRSLLASAGFEVVTVESRDADAATLAERVRDRLRGARIVAAEQLQGLPGGVEAAIECAGIAREAIADGVLGYSIFAARRIDGSGTR